MHLGIDARPLAHPKTGIGRYTNEVLKQLVSKTDWQITLYHLAAEPIENPYDLTIRPTQSLLGSNTLGFHFYAAKRANLDEIDCFFSPRHHLPGRLRAPSVVTIHDFVWKAVPKTMRRGGRWVEQLLMPKALQQASKIICVSEHTKSELCKWFPEFSSKAQVIYESSFQAEPKTFKRFELPSKYLLAVGTQEPRKNYSKLLEAIGELKRRGLGISLIIAGNPGWKSDVAARIKAGGLTEQIELVSDLQDSELAELYANCYALILPSVHEGFGLPIVEALKAGKPVLTSNCTAMPEISGGAGLLFEPSSSADIANKVELLFSDHLLYASLMLEAEKRSKDFSWDRAGDETIEVLKECVA